MLRTKLGAYRENSGSRSKLAGGDQERTLVRVGVTGTLSGNRAFGGPKSISMYFEVPSPLAVHSFPKLMSQVEPSKILP